MSHHLVETIDLCFSYPDSPPALNGVSLRITHGESVAVVGGNGAGKSTLLLHLNGLLTPSSGQVRVGDIPVTPKTVARVRESVGMVFQQAEDQLFMPTVREDVAFGPLNMGLPPEEIRRRNIQRRKELYEDAQGYYNSMLDILDLAYMNVTHEKLPPNVLKEWVGYITDEISQISKIKQSDKNR